MKELVHASRIQRWLADPLDQPVATALDHLAGAPDVTQISVMPDVHLATDVCVGIAMATRRLIYPAAVGGDIGCGMLAMRFRAPARILHDEAAAARILAGLYRRVPSLKHAVTEAAAVLPPDLAQAPLSHPSLEKLKSRDARLQLGTLGRGNHFIELQADQAQELWVLVHSGSRGMGQAITAHHLKSAVPMPGAGRRLLSLDSETAQGGAYLADQQWARDYAAANRARMLEAIIDVLRQAAGVEPDRESLLQSDHNHVRRELHGGDWLWVHRKGAQSAAEGEPGIVPGSMGSVSHHVIGRGHLPALASCSHGAGRVMSRTDAAQRISTAEVRQSTRHVWIDTRRRAEFREEAPRAYRDIRRVMEAQRELCKSIRVLQPLLNFRL